MNGRRSARRLLWRVYLVGIAQIAVAGIAIFVAQHLLTHAPWQFDRQRHHSLIDSFAVFYDSPDELDHALSNLEVVSLSFYRLDGSTVATTRPPLPPLEPEELERLRREEFISVPHEGKPPMTAVLVRRDGQPVGYGVALRRPPRPNGRPAHTHPSDPLPPKAVTFAIAATLLGAALISFLFARSLARPLAHLAATARSFGAGDLGARARLARNDELGEVAETFDEMADQVDGLLRGQRELLANVSHELRTPLARIRVALDIAAEGDLEASRQSLREIAKDWDDLDRLVEDVLTLVRFDLTASATPAVGLLRSEAIDAHTLVDRAAATFRSMQPQRALAVHIDDAPIPLHGDGALILRVLHNLLANAAKYSEPDTAIDLEVRVRPREVEFSVVDRGIGIDAADIPRLFEPFFRGDRSRARRSGGVGLGLALARRIVEAHGGTILVQSRVGEGTTVLFSIPTIPA
jgi:signal transduction histidine kinase